MSVLTVITAVRDDAEGTARTLESIRAQAPAPVDVVVIDGSADRTEVPDLLARSGPPSVTYHWQEPRGVYAAMNEGLARATGDYVYVIGAGDVLTTDVLEAMTTRLADQAPMWAYGRVRFDDGERVVEPAFDYAAERRRSFARGRFPAHQGVVMRRADLLAFGGFDTSYRVAADYAAILRFARAGSPDVWPFTIATFRTGGLSTRQWRVAEREFHRARRDILAPRGWDGAIERWDTASRRAATGAYHALWAPGRPLHAVVSASRRRGRSH